MKDNKEIKALSDEELDNISSGNTLSNLDLATTILTSVLGLGTVIAGIVIPAVRAKRQRDEHAEAVSQTISQINDTVNTSSTSTTYNPTPNIPPAPTYKPVSPPLYASSEESTSPPVYVPPDSILPPLYMPPGLTEENT